jgi:hypothetical protein
MHAGMIEPFARSLSSCLDVNFKNRSLCVVSRSRSNGARRVDEIDFEDIKCGQSKGSLNRDPALNLFQASRTLTTHGSNEVLELDIGS